MIKTLEKSARTEEEAINAALAELGLDRDDVSVEILERAKSGFLGIGASPALVRVSYEVPDEPKKAAPERKAASEKRPVREKPAAREKSAPRRPSQNSRPADEDDERRAREFLEGLLSRMDVQAQLNISRRDDGGLIIEICGEGMGAIIGRRGETLDAIQHLTNYAVNRGGEKHVHVSVDAENYRSRREDSLESLARKMAAKVLKYKRSMALEPMNSYERHVIHTALQDYPGVTTGSTGVEPNRRVVISFDAGSARRAPREEAPRREAPADPAAPVTPAAPAAPAAEDESKKPQVREWA